MSTQRKTTIQQFAPRGETEKIELFTTWAPLTLHKSVRGERQPTGGAKGELGGVGGLCSVETPDLTGETVLQKGLDFRYALKYGYFNLEHKTGPEHVIGHPTFIEPTTDEHGHPATAVEGVLYLWDDRARRIYDNAQKMAEVGVGRGFGFSIHGKTLERRGKEIVRSLILHISITMEPMHPGASLEILAKSLGATIGHVTPSSGGGTFAPLALQSIEGALSDAAIGNKVRITKKMLLAIVRDSHPTMDPDRVRDFVRTLWKLLKAQGHVQP